MGKTVGVELRIDDLDTVGNTVGELFRSDAFDTVGIVGLAVPSFGGGRNIGRESSSELVGVSIRYSAGRLPASGAIGIGGTRNAALDTVGSAGRLIRLGGGLSSSPCGERPRRCAGDIITGSCIGVSVSPTGISLSVGCRPR